ncbi:MAG: AMP-binding protein [Caldilineaceae bacterium]
MTTLQPRHPTLTAALEAAAAQCDAARGYIFLSRGAPVHLPYAQLWQVARQMAATLQQRGLAKGDRVVLTLGTSPEFAHVYWGLQLCGAVPCILPAPGAGREQSSAVRRILAVADQIEASAIIGSADDLAALAGQDQHAQLWDVAQLDLGDGAAWQRPCQSPRDLAVIQATSGSTGTPKCVALTQFNVLANLEQIGLRLRMNDGDVQICWVPIFHDMGLIGCFFLALYWQIPGVFLSPFQFLREPRSWLKAITDFKGTISPAPNFSYLLTTKRISDNDLAGLCLASWKAAICGAEQIDVNAIQDFAQRFHKVGLRSPALVPGYGMAEAALCITMYSPGEALNYETVLQKDLAERGVAVPVSPESEDPTTTLCDCGAVVEGTQLVIRNGAGEALDDGQVGQIWVAGPSLLQEYINLPSENAILLQAGWLNTGDLGYLRNGRLFVVGRSKEIIIIRGHNYAPVDFERAAEEVTQVTAGRVVAIGIPNAHEGTEQLVILCEQPREKLTLPLAEWQRTIQTHVGKRTGILPAQVLILPRNAIPRTTSGKLQRGLMRKMVMEGQIEIGRLGD